MEDEGKDVTCFRVPRCSFPPPLGFLYNSFGSCPHSWTHTFPSSHSPTKAVWNWIYSCHHTSPSSSFLYSKPSFPILLRTQRGYYFILATTSPQLMNSVNILRMTTGHFLSVWPRNYSKLKKKKKSRKAEAPKRMPVKITSKGIVGLSLESAPLFIHSFTPQGQTVRHAYFCRHCETWFQDFM